MERIKDKIEGLKKEGKSLRREVRERTADYIVASLGLIAGLAWNEAVKSLIEYIFPGNQNTLFAKFLYAAFITFVVVLISFYLLRFAKEEKSADEH